MLDIPFFDLESVKMSYCSKYLNLLSVNDYIQFRMSWKVHTFGEDMVFNMVRQGNSCASAGLDSFVLKL